MESQVKAITLRARYESDLSGLKTDSATLKAFRRQWEKTPIKVPVRLDLSGIKADAAKAGAEIRKAVQAAIGGAITPGSTVTKGGIIIPASAMRDLKQFQATSAGAFKQIVTDGDKAIKTFAQLERGIQQVTTTRKTRGGATKTSVTQIDTTPLTAFKKQLEEIERAFAKPLGSARGNKGDVASLLEEKQKRIAAVLAGKGLENIRNTPLFAQAEKSLDRLEQRIATTRGTQDRANAKQSRGLRIDTLKDSLREIDGAISGKLGATRGAKGDVASVLAEKYRLIQAELAKFSDIADSPAYRQAQKTLDSLNLGFNRSTQSQKLTAEKAAETAARKAESTRKQSDSQRATQDTKIGDRSLQAKIKANKIDEAAAVLIDHKAVREQRINEILTQREKLLEQQVAHYKRLEDAATLRGSTAAASKYSTAGLKAQNELNQVSVDRARLNNRSVREESDADLQRRLTNALQMNKVRREELKLEEASAKLITNRTQRNAKLTDIQQRRANLLTDTHAEVSNVHQQARGRGLRGLENTARTHLGTLESTATSDMRRLATATNQSGHAFNFHSNALLKNATTFIKWYIPAQAAMKSFQLLGQGIDGAIEAQRTFKILGAVYRGSAEEAAMLADQTLMLAAANGRSADEAAQSVVAWARLGLTRTQALMAVETSLRAANVAEISAAEATAYLTANYKAFGQTIADIPATLDYINSLSNQNAVAPKVIFEGLSRSAKVAHDTGLEFKELAGIIATVSATTQRPGAEIGNSIKSVASRIYKQDTISSLKSEFGYDVKNADGGAKSLNQVLGDLAALYPTLNTLEQGRLRNLVAGNLQGNRFAVIMQTWNESLIAQAAAGLDANSAMRENAQILDSVDAKLTKLSTTWTHFWQKIGQAGGFDLLGKAIDDVGTLLDLATRIGRGSGTADSKGSATKNSLSFIEKYAAYASTAGARIAGITSGNFSDIGQPLSDAEIRNAGRTLAGNGFFGGIGNNIQNKAEGIDQGLKKDRISKLVDQTVQSQNRVDSYSKAEEALNRMTQQFGTKGVSTQQTLSEFKDYTEKVLPKLPNGQQLAGEANQRILPLLSSGDVEAGRNALSGEAFKFSNLSKQEFKNSEAGRTSAVSETKTAIEETRKKQDDLNAAMAKGGENADQQAILKERYDQTTATLKEQEEALSRLNKEFEKPIPDQLAPFKDRLDAFRADLKLAGDAYGQLLNTFGSSGFANLDAKLKLGGALMERNLLRQTRDATIAQNEPLNAYDQSQIDRLKRTRTEQNAYAVDPALYNLQNQVDSRNAIAGALDTQFQEIDKLTPEIVRKNELERQTALLQGTYQDSRTTTQSRYGAYDIGQTEGARLASRTGRAIGDLQADVNNPNLGNGNATQDAQELGAMTERLTQSKQGLMSLEDRMNRALAERVNLEGEIAEANRKQTEETSRRLALASREDQLRVAAAKAVLGSRGKSQFSLQEFQFFSQETRGALSNLTPRSVKGLDETEQSQNESRQKLNKEIQQITITLAALRPAFETLKPKAEAKAAGLIDAENPFGKNAPTGSAITGNKDEIRVNLNTGPINVQLDFSQHVRTITDTLQTGLDNSLKAGLNRILEIVRGGSGPNTAAAAGAF